MIDLHVIAGAGVATRLLALAAGPPGPGPSAAGGGDGDGSGAGQDAQRREGDLTTRDGARLHWASRGSGPDTVVVPAAWMLADALGAMGRKHTVVYYDMRSRGRSGRIEDPERLGFGLDVRDLEDVRRHFGLERMSLVGFSYLGGVAARYAVERPRRVRRLVLLGAVPPRSPAPYTEGAPGAQEVLGPGRIDRLRALREGDVGPEDPEDRCRAYWEAILPLYTGTPEAAERLAADLDLGCGLRNERPEAFGRVLGHVMAELEAYDWRADARELEIPTLVVHGVRDHVAPVGGAREWARLAPRSRLVEVDGVGHLLWAERPGDVREAIARFLAEGAAGPGEGSRDGGVGR